MKKVFSILLAFLLTGMLIVFCMSFLGQQLIMPAMDEDGMQASDELIREEQRLIQKRIEKLADLYGFRAEPVANAITEDTLRDLNAQTSLWWSSILKHGRTGEAIRWKTDELERILAENLTTDDPENAEGVTAAAVDAVRSSVIRTVLPMRQQILEVALHKAGEKLDLANLINFFLGTPWAELALCVLLAGVIALIWSRQTIRGALPYIGGALGAAALVMIAAAVLYLCADIRPMIREASESLAFMYQKAATQTTVRAGILTAVMAVGGILCLALGGKREKNA